MIQREVCRNCGSGKLKSWADLTEDEQHVVERLPASAEVSRKERERSHRWCTRCWYETTVDEAGADV
jgi:hypothetical protein